MKKAVLVEWHSCRFYYKVKINVLSLYYQKKHSEHVLQRRLVLRRIINIIKFIGTQGLAFRGKHEAAFSLDNNNTNHGNFLALVLLLAKYDPVLDRHVNTSIEASKKRKETHHNTKGLGNLVTFLSKTTINKLINICGNQIQLAIASQVKEAWKLSLEVDSCQDVGVMDQVAICVRYVRNGIVHERLLCMTPIRTAGRQYFELVKTILNNLGLDIRNIIISAFDGASNMSRRYNGLQAALKEVSPLMIYTHCYAHSLNLVMVGSCSSCLEARLFFGLLEKVAVFIGNPYKRTSKWIENLDQLVEGRETLRRLQKIGTTRWWAKDKALETIFDVNRYWPEGALNMSWPSLRSDV